MKDALENEQDLDLAIQILNSLLLKQETRLEAMALRNFQLGNVFMLKLDAEKALPFFLRAYQLVPTSFNYARAYGVELLKAGKTIDSIAPLKHAITNFNDLPPAQQPSLTALSEVRVSTGAAYAMLGRNAEAEQMLKGAVALNLRAPALDPQATFLTASALFSLASIQGQNGNLELRTATLAQASDLVSASLDRDFLRFQPLMRQILISQSLLDATGGDLRLAELRLQQAMTLEKRAAGDLGTRNSAGRAEILYHLGAHYGSTGRYLEAADAARESVTIYRALRANGAPVTQHKQEFAGALMLHARMMVQIDPSRALEAEVLATEALTTLAQHLNQWDTAATEFLIMKTLDFAEIQLISGNNQSANLFASDGVKMYKIMTQLRGMQSDPGHLARALQAAGNASSRLGRIQVADQYFTEAVDIARASGRSSPGYARRKYVELLRDVERHYIATNRGDLAAKLAAEIEELSSFRK